MHRTTTKFRGSNQGLCKDNPTLAQRLEINRSASASLLHASFWVGRNPALERRAVRSRKMPDTSCLRNWVLRKWLNDRPAYGVFQTHHIMLVDNVRRDTTDG